MTTADKLPTVKLGAYTYRLPFAHLIRALTPRERADLEESIVRRHGKVLVRVVTYTSAAWGVRCVIDGANRLGIAADNDLDLPVQDRGPMSDEDARAECLALNLDRRQHTPEEMKLARAARIVRVIEASELGDSLRTIAAQEGVSLGQIQRDLKDGSSVSGDTPDPLAPVERIRVVLRSIYRTKGESAAGALPVLLGGPYAERLKQIAQRHGAPLDGDRWPLLEQLQAVWAELVAEASAGV